MKVNRKWKSGNKGDLFSSYFLLFCFKIGYPRLQCIIQGEVMEAIEVVGGNAEEKFLRKQPGKAIQRSIDGRILFDGRGNILSLTSQKAGKRGKYSHILVIFLVIRKGNSWIRVCNLCITNIK